MKSINTCVFTGTVGRNPEMKTTANSLTKMLKFSLAVSDDYLPKGSQVWVNRTHWIDCKLWGPRADKWVSEINKGTKVLIKGSLSTYEYEDKSSGEKKRNFEINVDDVAILASKRKDDDLSPPSFSEPTFAADEIPF